MKLSAALNALNVQVLVYNIFIQQLVNSTCTILRLFANKDMSMTNHWGCNEWNGQGDQGGRLGTSEGSGR